ncbi:alpha/beta fold hydrolase [Isoptericola croceus]|uniref:alpha/beta fold hydrolase n=1 Tax=Isoptericola croceus TaxID=3031406 RepID=UPI0023F8C39B|nr:alpha/beta hydrolase [Isoptericola croceus]
MTIGAPCISPTSRGAAARCRAVWQISGAVSGLLPISLIRNKLPEGTATTPAAQEYVRGVTREFTRESFGALVDVSREAGRGLKGKRIGVPVLATRGAQDVSAAGRLTVMTAATWPVDSSSFRYEEIPEAGHQAHQDNPEAFSRLLLDFLDGLPI